MQEQLNDFVDDAAVPVPASRTRQLIPNDDARKIISASKILASRNVQVMLRCNACAEAGRMPLIEATRAEETGELLLVCFCTLRILEGVK